MICAPTGARDADSPPALRATPSRASEGACEVRGTGDEGHLIRHPACVSRRMTPSPQGEGFTGDEGRGRARGYAPRRERETRIPLRRCAPPSLIRSRASERAGEVRGTGDEGHLIRHPACVRRRMTPSPQGEGFTGDEGRGGRVGTRPCGRSLQLPSPIASAHDSLRPTTASSPLLPPPHYCLRPRLPSLHTTQTGGCANAQPPGLILLIRRSMDRRRFLALIPWSEPW